MNIDPETLVVNGLVPGAQAERLGVSPRSRQKRARTLARLAMFLLLSLRWSSTASGVGRATRTGTGGPSCSRTPSDKSRRRLNDVVL